MGKAWEGLSGLLGKAGKIFLALEFWSYCMTRGGYGQMEEGRKMVLESWLKADRLA